jgi:D-beta-D-heptose 7-phosphate kinase/D-beta-D-heptose 1-phosphate adenosyltransferase
MVNGTFDILHRGHIEMLNYAKSKGDYLLVAIDTDRRVSELKGPSRPITNQEDRKFHLENLKAVDEVQFFDSKEQLIDIMKSYKPDVYVKGSDWQGKSIEAANHCDQVIFYSRVGDYSTTNTILRISSPNEQKINI